MTNHQPLDLFDLANRPAARDEQAAHLARVGGKIGPSVEAFWRQKLHADSPQFHVAELLAFVKATNPETAPASADRILRDLRANRVINYKVVKRKDSLYEALPLQPKS